MASKAKNGSKRIQSVSTEEVLRLHIDDLLTRLNSSQQGLASKEAERLLEICGYNEMARKERRADIIRFLLHFKNPLVLILLLAGMISGIVGELVNSIIIFSIVLMSVILDFIQESKAERAADELRERVSTTATVVRNGVKQEV